MTTTGTNPQDQVDPSVRELVTSATKDLQNLIKGQIELAKLELQESMKTAAAASGLFVAAGVLAALGFIFLLVTIAYVLVALGLPVWAGFGIVTLVLFIVTAILLLVGKKRAAKIKGPERTQVQIELTKDALSNLAPKN